MISSIAATALEPDPRRVALLQARLTGAAPALDELEGGFEEALTLQLDVLSELRKAGHGLGGWKVGLTSGNAHDLMGVGFRPFGYILANRVLRSGVALGRGPKLSPQIEPELCLRMGLSLQGSDIPPEACRAAVAEVRAAFEINETRVPHEGRHRLFIADGLANWGLVLGSGTDPRGNLARTKVELFFQDELVATSAPDLVMDDPFVSLSRLCTQLNQFGLGLEAGQHVITGAFLRQRLDKVGVYRARFDNVGEVELRTF